MPLTLTSRDKAYVRAVAHGGAHDMYRGYNGTVTSGISHGKFYLGSGHDRQILIHLGEKPKSQIAKTWHTGNNFEGQDIDHDVQGNAYKNSYNMGMFYFPKSVDAAATTKEHNFRYGDNVFLESTNVRVRVCLPHDRYNADENTLGRFIVFRTKEKQNHIPEESLDHANPHYDLFLDQDGLATGLNGFVDHKDAENYVNMGTQFDKHSTSIQNMLLNKKKYVVMKDCKFNLGKDFGALAFETNLRWDWKDQMNDIPAGREDITAAQDGDGPNKNYEWYILVLGLNPSGSTATQKLNVELFGTTHAKTMD